MGARGGMVKQEKEKDEEERGAAARERRGKEEVTKEGWETREGNITSQFLHHLALSP